jgi:hypothetical protein
VVLVFSPLPRRKGETYARRISETGGAAIISDEGVCGSSRGLRVREQAAHRGDSDIVSFIFHHSDR